MDEHPPSWLSAPGCCNGADPKDEAYCRAVIFYVRREGPQERADEATSRLEAELDAMLREGTLHLPDVRDVNQTSDGTVRSASNIVAGFVPAAESSRPTRRICTVLPLILASPLR